MVSIETLGALLRSAFAAETPPGADKAAEGLMDALKQAITISAANDPKFTLAAVLLAFVLTVLGIATIYWGFKYLTAVHKEKQDPVYREVAKEALRWLESAKKTISKDAQTKKATASKRPGKRK